MRGPQVRCGVRLGPREPVSALDVRHVDGANLYELAEMTRQRQTRGDLLLLRALEYHFPNTVITLEGPFKHIPDEGPREVFEANGGAKRTVCGYGAADVSRVELEPCLTKY